MELPWYFLHKISSILYVIKLLFLTWLALQNLCYSRQQNVAVTHLTRILQINFRYQHIKAEGKTEYYMPIQKTIISKIKLRKNILQQHVSYNILPYSNQHLRGHPSFYSQTSLPPPLLPIHFQIFDHLVFAFQWTLDKKKQVNNPLQFRFEGQTSSVLSRY